MPIFLRFDIAILTLSIVFAASLVITVLGSGSFKPLNVYFIHYTSVVTLWAVFSLLLHVSLWFRIGDPLLLLELAALSSAMSGPFLLLFTARYLDIKSRWPAILAVVAIVGITILAPLLLTGRFLYNPRLTANGTDTFDLSTWAIAASLIPCSPMAVSLFLFLVYRDRMKGYLIATSALFVSAGFVLGGIVRVSFPIMSATHALGVGMLGFYVLRNQLFNPLKGLASELEREVRERTHDLEQARAEVEQTVAERTERLLEEISERTKAETLLKERADRLELIAHIGRKTTALLATDELLDQTVDLIRDAFEYFSVNIALIEGEYLVLRATSLHAFHPMVGKFRLKVGQEGITGWVAGSGEPLLSPDVTLEPRYIAPMEASDTRSELAVPLKLRGKIIGVLDAQSVRVDAFTPLDLFTQQTIADQLANAIESVQLYNQVTRRAETLAFMNRISAAVSAVQNTTDLMETVYREIAPIFAADAFFIALYQEGKEGLDFRFQMNEGRKEPSEEKPMGAALAERIVREKKALLINNGEKALEKDGRSPSSWLGVPMLIGERPVGVICVQTYTKRLYDEEDRALLGTVADQIAIAVENARLYEALKQELGERGRTEKTLRESEEQFRNLAEQTPNMIFINRSGRVVYANRECELTTGYSRDEFYSHDFNFMDITAPEFRPLVAQNFRKHLNGEEVAPYEYALMDRSGRRVDSLITTKLIRHAGEPAILGIITDISSRKHTERLVRSLNVAALAMEQALTPEEIFPAAVNELTALGFSCAIVLTDSSKERIRLRYAAGAAAESHRESGGEEEDWFPIGDADSAVIQTLRERRTMLSDMDPRAISDGRALGAPGSGPAGLSPEGERTIFSPLAAADDLMGFLSVSGKNLGEEDLPVIAAFAHQTAAAYRKTTLMRDLEQSLKELRTAQDLLLHAQKMEAIGRLAGGIAHDFNNALTVISGFTSLLGESLVGNDAALSDLAEIKNAIKRASALTSRLLAFSRRQILQPEVLDLNAVLSGCVKLLRPLIGENIEMLIRPAAEPTPIKADRYQIEQVIVNLAVNARDAMPAGGTLVVETALRRLSTEQAVALSIPAGPYSTLTVRDNGIGMSENIQSRIFEPFFTTKEDGKGTGLGLSTVYGIVNQTGGAIVVDSAPGKGSVFTVFIPLCLEEGRACQPETSTERPPAGTGTILLVEDDDSVRDLAGRILSKAGYTVLSAASGDRALEIAAETRAIQIVITDVVMPGMNGVEMSHRLGELRPEVPVLFMSGYTDEPSIHLGVPDGLPFISKPFQPEDLLRKVADLLSD